MKRQHLRLLGFLSASVILFCGLWAFKWVSPSAPDVADLVRAIELGDDVHAAKLIQLGLGEHVYRPPADIKRWKFPIHVAAAEGNTSVLTLLLSRADSDPDIRDFEGFTPLMYLCDFCEVRKAYQYEKSIGVLLRKGANVNAASRSGTTALHLASYPTFLAELLLAAGADPHRKDVAGDTPLHSACKGIRISEDGSSADAVPSLLIAGADPTALNGAGLTPRQLAEQEQRDDIIRILDRFSKLVKEK